MFPRFPLPALLLCCGMSLPASAGTEIPGKQRLLEDINNLLKNQPGAASQVVQAATLLTPGKQLALLCAEPVLSLATEDPRLSGRRSVIARCGARRHFLQIAVKASATWWVAKNALPAGRVIAAGDIIPCSGELPRHAAEWVFDATKIIGQTPLRPVTAGSVLQQNQLRRPWQVHSGERVQIITTGGGFRIRSEGRALSNAALNETVKVQTGAGKTVNAVVSASGQVAILLAQ